MTDRYTQPSHATLPRPTDPVSVDGMTDRYTQPSHATLPRPTDPVSVDGMTERYSETRQTAPISYSPKVPT